MSSPLGPIYNISPIDNPQNSPPRPFIDIDDLHWALWERLSSIQDPEFKQTLEALDVISEESLTITATVSNSLQINVVFKPTVPHCSYASLIGLCLIYVISNVIHEFNFTPAIPTHMLYAPHIPMGNIPSGAKNALPDQTLGEAISTTGALGGEQSEKMTKGGSPTQQEHMNELLAEPNSLNSKFVKMNILLEKGSHNTEKDLNRQFNDKERVYGAFENPTLLAQIKKLCDFGLNQH
jgi:hypothetical protein